MSEVELNPFNDKFNINQFKKVLLHYNKENNQELYSLIKSFILFNDFHNDFYQQIVEFLKTTDKDINNVIDLAFVVFNRNYLVNHHKSIKEVRPNSRSNMLDYAARKIKSTDKTLGDVNILAALETESDSLNLISNLIRHILTQPLTKITHADPVKPIELLKSVLLASSVYYTLKSIYEDALWNNGEFEFEPIQNAIFVTFPNQDRLFYHKIGHVRIQSTSLQHFFYMKEQIENGSTVGNLLRQNLMSTKNDKKIKDVKIDNGRIKIRLAKKHSLRDLYSELTTISTIEAYYPFIELYAKNKNAQDLSVSDFVVLLSSIQEVFGHVQNLHLDTSLYSLEDLKRYPVKIEVIELTNYLIQRTTYSSKQINYFLRIITSSFDDRIDFWTNVLLKYNQHYYFSFISLVNPIVGNIIDSWLEKTGYPLTNRGELFEKYIKTQLNQILSSRKFVFQIETRNEININGKKEEIDLIFCLEEIAFVCEIKCTKYSTTNREDHNAYKILKKASNQAIRKCNFIKKEFKDDKGLNEMLANKKIVPLIITNYPLYTGLKIENVPIVDFYLLDNYFNSGSISSGYYTNENGVTKNIKLSTEKFYTDERSMNNNVLDFINSPTPIIKQIDNYKIESSKFTPGNFPFEVYSEYCTNKTSVIVDNE